MNDNQIETQDTAEKYIINTKEEKYTNKEEE